MLVYPWSVQLTWSRNICWVMSLIFFLFLEIAKKVFVTVGVACTLTGTTLEHNL